jgi:hypothetical protein
LACGFLSVDGGMARFAETLLALGEAAQFIIKEKLRKGCTFGWHGVLNDLYNTIERGDFIGVDANDILEARITVAIAATQGWQQPIMAGGDFNQ